MSRTLRSTVNTTSSTITSAPNGPTAPQNPPAPVPTTGVASSTKAKKAAQAQYTAADLKKMIDFLVEHAAEAGDNGTFTQSVFNECTKHLNQHIEVGGPKTPKSVRDKYSKYFRVQFKIIQMIINKSGWPAWTDDGGANMPIIGPDDPLDNLSSSWNDFVVLNPAARPFRNAGWPYLAQMRSIIPTATATGRNVTRATLPPSSQVVEDTQEQSGADFESDDDRDAESGQQLNKLDDHQSPANSVTFSPDHTQSDIDQLLEPSQTMSNEPMDIVRRPLGSSNTSSSTKRKAPDTPFTPKPDLKRRMQSATSSSNPTRTLTGPLAIADMTGAVREWTSTAVRLFEKRPTFPTSPERKATAIARCQEVEDVLSSADLSSLINVFERDSSKATTYLALVQGGREDVRTNWVNNAIAAEIQHGAFSSFSV